MIPQKILKIIATLIFIFLLTMPLVPYVASDVFVTVETPTPDVFMPEKQDVDAYHVSDMLMCDEFICIGIDNLIYIRDTDSLRDMLLAIATNREEVRH